MIPIIREPIPRSPAIEFIPPPLKETREAKIERNYAVWLKEIEDAYREKIKLQIRRRQFAHVYQQDLKKGSK